MRNMIFILTTFLTMFLFSGCVTYVTNYESRFLTPNLDLNKNKVNISVNIEDNSPKNLEKKPNGFIGSGATHIFQLSDINSNVSEKFFEQYFYSVNQNKESLLKVNTKISHFDFNFTGYSVHMNVIINIEVFLNNENILTEEYKEFFDSGGQFNLFNFSGEEMTGHAMTKNAIHRELFKFYENKFKPDLIEALKKHYIK